MAHAFIDAIAKAGADAVKFQTHIAEAESTPAEPWRIKFSPQDKTRYDYWKRMEFTEDQWQGLKTHAQERGLQFLSSPFSVEAVELLTRVGVAAWKIASGEVTNEPMFERMAATGLPIILSTGMSTLSEIDASVERITRAGLELAILQCTSIYPTVPEKLGLNMISFFRDRYGCKVGLSDHSGTIYAGLAASALGMDVLEVHVTFSREMFGPDVSASITIQELSQLVEGIRFIEKATRNPVDKDTVTRELQSVRDLFTKSVVARMDLPAGTVLQASDLAVKKPGLGIPADQIRCVIGRRLRRRLEHDELIKVEDLSDEV
jgi:N-acetylneuraminate synthase